MIIRKIMVALAVMIGLSVLALVVWAVSLLVKAFPVCTLVVVIAGVVVNFAGWANTCSNVKCMIKSRYKIWHIINWTVYTAGVYWAVRGLALLWRKAPEIENWISVMIKPVRRIDKPTAGELSLTPDGGYLGIKEKSDDR